MVSLSAHLSNKNQEMWLKRLGSLRTLQAITPPLEAVP